MHQGRGSGKEAHEDTGVKAITQRPPRRKGLRTEQKRKVTKLRGSQEEAESWQCMRMVSCRRAKETQEGGGRSGSQQRREALPLHGPTCSTKGHRQLRTQVLSLSQPGLKLGACHGPSSLSTEHPAFQVISLILGQHLPSFTFSQYNWLLLLLFEGENRFS